MEAETPPWRGLRLVNRDGPVFRTKRDFGPGAGTFHYHEVEENKKAGLWWAHVRQKRELEEKRYEEQEVLKFKD